MRALLMAVVGLLLLITAAPADARLERSTLLDVGDSGPVDVDLDGDGIAERLFTTERDDGFVNDPFIEPECGVRRRLGPGDERIAIEAIRVAGSAALPMIGVFSSSGASGRIERTRAHYLDPPTSPGECPVLRTVFRFPHRSARRPRPPRGTSPGSFSARPFERRGRIWFRTFEGLYRRSDAGCCPSYTRRIDWRPRGDRYVRAKTRVRKLPQP